LTVAIDGENVTLNIKTSDSSTAMPNEQGEKFLQKTLKGKQSMEDRMAEEDGDTSCIFTQEGTFDPEGRKFTMEYCSNCTTKISLEKLKAMLEKHAE